MSLPAWATDHPAEPSDALAAACRRCSTACSGAAGRQSEPGTKGSSGERQRDEGSCWEGRLEPDWVIKQSQLSHELRLQA